MEGTISSVEDDGNIVVWLDVEGAVHPVCMDHRMYGLMVGGEGVGAFGDLIGRPVYSDGEAIEFLENLEAA